VRFQVLDVNGYADFIFIVSMLKLRHHCDVIVSCDGLVLAIAVREICTAAKGWGGA
jgi:hypothetical protein